MTSPPSLSRSPIWERLHAGPLSDPASIDLDRFRSSGPLFSISVWDPSRHGLRYLKTLLHNLLMAGDKGDLELYRRIPNRHVGEPLTVRAGGVDVCLDYFQAVDEAKCLAAAGLPPDGARLVEIGPGYGRTCHALISLYERIAEYWLVDLAPSLVLARRYLARVLDEASFAKLRFITPSEIEGLRLERRFDIALNVDSFGDLPPDVVRAYLDFLDRHCDAFYCKNPVGKYLDASLRGEALNSERVQQALKTGLARTVIDIFDTDAVAAAVPEFLDVYRPSSDWELVFHRPAPPWSYYHQAVFGRRKR